MATKPARNKFRGRFGRASGKQVGDSRKRVWVCDKCDLQHVNKKPEFFCMDSNCGGTTFTHFDSIAEANRWAALKLEAMAEHITNLRRQIRMPLLVPGPQGLPVKIGEIRPDFAYTVVRGNQDVIEDVKGAITDKSIWKIKHCEAQYGVKIKLFKKD